MSEAALPPNGHALAEATSLALHREVARRLAEDPAVLQRARAKVAAWGDEVHPFYREAWSAILAGPIDEIRAVLLDDGERARDLRQCTPFSLDPSTRWRIWREVRGR